MLWIYVCHIKAVPFGTFLNELCSMQNSWPYDFLNHKHSRMISKWNYCLILVSLSAIWKKGQGQMAALVTIFDLLPTIRDHCFKRKEKYLIVSYHGNGWDDPLGKV